MIEYEPKRKPRGVRKHIRNDKAEIRRNFAPTGSYITETKVTTIERLTVLDIRLVNYFTNDGQLEAQLRTDAHDVQNSMQLGQFLAQKINQDLSVTNASTLGGVALNFVEREWIESALGLIKRDELPLILRSFLDACDEKVQKYLEEREIDHDLTRLQEVKSRVINPITGALTKK